MCGVHFTRYHSLDDILGYPYMREYLNIFFAEKNLNMFPEKLSHLPLARIEQMAECPWNESFACVTNQLLDAADTVLDVIERHDRRCVLLWEEEQDWTPERDKKGGKESVFLLTPERNTSKYPVMHALRAGGLRPERNKKQALKEAGGSGKKPAVIICPGGGYETVCFSGEGNPVMNYMEAKGYAVFMLKYRTAPDRYPAPQEDLAMALKYVRRHAGEYGVDPHDVMLMGFSAGGHLCASLSCFYRELAETLSAETGEKTSQEDIRPDKLCLGYPVITFGEECHEGSFQMLTGGDELMREKLSLEKQITDDYPPVFVWACEDDSCVPASNAVRLADALKKAGVPCMLRVYPSGGHGCNLAFGNSACTWTEEMLRFMKEKGEKNRGKNKI